VKFLGSCLLYLTENGTEGKLVLGHDPTTATPPPGYSLALGIIMQELCPSDLFVWSTQKPKKGIGKFHLLKESESLDLLRDVGTPLRDLAEEDQLSHNDVKDDNIGITLGPDGKWIYKLFDFGLAVKDPKLWHQARRRSARVPPFNLKSFMATDEPEPEENLDLPFWTFRDYLRYTQNCPNPFLRDAMRLAYIVHWFANPQTADGYPDPDQCLKNPLFRLLRHVISLDPSEFITVGRLMSAVDQLYEGKELEVVEPFEDDDQEDDKDDEEEEESDKDEDEEDEVQV